MKYTIVRGSIYALLVAAIVHFEPAHAAKMHVHWTAPTANTDGTPLLDLAGFRVEWGSCNKDGTFGQFQAGASVGPAVTSAWIYPTGLKLVCARVFAFNTANALSVSSNVGQGTPPIKLSQPTH
jgi:hypothetical protein